MQQKVTSHLMDKVPGQSAHDSHTYEAMCWGCKENTNYNIKDAPHTRLNSCKGARLYNCAAVATCNSDTFILSLVNH